MPRDDVRGFLERPQAFNIFSRGSYESAKGGLVLQALTSLLRKSSGDTGENPLNDPDGSAASRDKTGTIVIAICLALSAVIFIVDLMLPLGVAGGVPYVAVVLVAMWSTSPRFMYITGAVTSVLVVAGYLFSPEGSATWMVLLNRSLALFAIWVTAILGSMLIRALIEAKNEKKKAETYLEVAGTILMTVGRNQKITMINKMGCSLLGFGENELVGKNWFDSFIPKRSRNEERICFQKLFSDGQGSTMVNSPSIASPVLTASNHERLIAWRCTPIRGEDGSVIEILCSGEDITEQKEVENELRRTKKRAEESTKLRDRFLSLVSHDLRNPLSLLLTFLKSMRQNKKLGLDEKERKLLGTSIHSAEAMADMISELLEMTRLKNGIMKPERKFINLRLLVLNQIFILAHLAERKGISLVNNISKNRRIYADPRLCAAVVQNLVANSIKFSDRGDTIAVFVPKGEPSTIAIFDTGMGIEPARFSTIFKYEVQTSTQGSSGERGTGLGLPLCREIMEAHRGKLHVMSAPHEGCTFMAAFPDIKPKVLIVEDDIPVSNEIKDMLVNDGADVECVVNGKSARDAISSSEPHLILMDSAASRINGTDLLHYLKNDKKLHQIPIIITGASVDDELLKRAMHYDAVECLEKALVSEKLMPLVRKHIG